jgi:membrane protease YdiL (CAAX protease family)
MFIIKQKIMRQKLHYILAICIGILPINIIMIWYRLTHNEGFTTYDMLLYPLVFGGGSVLLILALNKYLLKEKVKDFNSGEGKWFWDILTGLLLTAIYFLLMYIERATIAGLLPQGKPPSQEVINLMTDLANNPVLLIIWLGPVVWIGVALFEEISRVFFYNCLWRISGDIYWKVFTILFVAIFWGFTHLYQGTFGIISVSIQGIVMGLYYYKFRRIWPLIISHALYDSIQIIMFVIQVS